MLRFARSLAMIVAWFAVLLTAACAQHADPRQHAASRTTLHVDSLTSSRHVLRAVVGTDTVSLIEASPIWPSDPANGFYAYNTVSDSVAVAVIPSKHARRSLDIWRLNLHTQAATRLHTTTHRASRPDAYATLAATVDPRSQRVFIAWADLPDERLRVIQRTVSAARPSRFQRREAPIHSEELAPLVQAGGSALLRASADRLTYTVSGPDTSATTHVSLVPDVQAAGLGFARLNQHRLGAAFLPASLARGTSVTVLRLDRAPGNRPWQPAHTEVVDVAPATYCASDTSFRTVLVDATAEPMPTSPTYRPPRFPRTPRNRSGYDIVMLAPAVERARLMYVSPADVNLLPSEVPFDALVAAVDLPGGSASVDLVFAEFCCGSTQAMHETCSMTCYAAYRYQEGEWTRSWTRTHCAADSD